MIPDRNDDQLLKRIVDGLLAQPIPEGPPDEVRQRVLALGECTSRRTVVGPPPQRARFADWIGAAVVAAALMAALDLGWWRFVNATTPVGWFREPESDTWRVLYDNTRVEIRRPPAEIRTGA